MECILLYLMHIAVFKAEQPLFLKKKKKAEQPLTVASFSSQEMGLQ